MERKIKYAPRDRAFTQFEPFMRKVAQIAIQEGVSVPKYEDQAFWRSIFFQCPRPKRALKLATHDAKPMEPISNEELPFESPRNADPYHVEVTMKPEFKKELEERQRQAIIDGREK